MNDIELGSQERFTVCVLRDAKKEYNKERVDAQLILTDKLITLKFLAETNTSRDYILNHLRSWDVKGVKFRFNFGPNRPLEVETVDFDSAVDLVRHLSDNIRRIKETAELSHKVLTAERRLSDVMHILTITAWSLLLQVIAVRYAKDTLQSDLINKILPYPEELDVNNDGHRAVHAIANGLVLFAIVYGLIGVLLLLFRYIKNKVALQSLSMLITAGVLGLFTSVTLIKLIQVQNISFDWIFFMYIVWNITICGVVVVSGYASHKTKMFAVVFLATIMAFPFAYLPEWAIWTLLMLVASTDIIIALFVSPRHFRFKELRNDPNFIWQKLSNTFPLALSTLEDNTAAEIHHHMMWFGVGNYMFYSIAIIYPAVNDVLYLLVAFISVLAGVLITGILLLKRPPGRLFPALVIPLAITILCYAGAKYFLRDFTLELFLNGVYV